MMSRTSADPHSESCSSTVRPSTSVKTVVTKMPGPGAPSKTSVLTIRSPSTISWYSPWKATSKPPVAVIT